MHKDKTGFIRMLIGVNASLSFASAVPGVGWASASVKLGLMRVLKPLGG
jgi:predicted membrane protein